MFTKNRKSKRILQLVITACLIAFIICIFSYVITAKNTYIITDGEKTMVVESFFIDTDAAIKQAGISLGFLDSYIESPGSDGSTKISISRACNITIRQNGISTFVITKDSSIGDVLEKLNISINDYMYINYPPDTEPFEGMLINIISIPEIQETITELMANLQPNQTTITESLDENKNDTHLNDMKIATAAGDISNQMNEETAVAEIDMSNQWYAVTAAPESANGAIDNGYITTSSGETLAYNQILYCSATAYTTERQENKITATGTTARVGAIAVDPKIIPYGSKMYIVSDGGEWIYGYAVAEDCGGGIKGNKIDLFFDTYDECIDFGVRNAVVYVLTE